MCRGVTERIARFGGPIVRATVVNSRRWNVLGNQQDMGNSGLFSDSVLGGPAATH